MFVKFPDHTSEEIDVDALIAGFKSGEIKFAYINSLAAKLKLSDHDYTKILNVVESLSPPPIMPPAGASDCIRRSLEYQSAYDKQKLLDEKTHNHSTEKP